jgi:hypothetical protein
MPAAERPVVPFRLGDRVELAKAHPCGGRTWGIVRLGADIGLVCEGCGRRVLLERRELERRLTNFVDRGPEPAERGPEPAERGPEPARPAAE